MQPFAINPAEVEILSEPDQDGLAQVRWRGFMASVPVLLVMIRTEFGRPVARQYKEMAMSRQDAAAYSLCRLYDEIDAYGRADFLRVIGEHGGKAA